MLQKKKRLFLFTLSIEAQKTSIRVPTMTLRIWMYAAINGSECICHEAQTPNCVKINLFPVELRRDAARRSRETKTGRVCREGYQNAAE